MARTIIFVPGPDRGRHERDHSQHQHDDTGGHQTSSVTITPRRVPSCLDCCTQQKCVAASRRAAMANSTTHSRVLIDGARSICVCVRVCVCHVCVSCACVRVCVCVCCARV